MGPEPEGWLPVIKEFQELIESDQELHKGFQQMFEQASNEGTNLGGGSEARDYMDMLGRINDAIQRAPAYDPRPLGACSLLMILDRVLRTPAGVATLAHPKVNAQFKKLLDFWATFLSSPESRSVLTTEENGWFGHKARVDRDMAAFVKTYVCDPTAPYHGFKSWDDYFTRRFRPGVRPVEYPDDNSVINGACESIVYCIARDIKCQDSFWLKGQPYSLHHMLQNDPLTEQFVGGTIFQCFLSASHYHRWHSPVNGRVVKTRLVPGVYFTQLPATENGWNSDPISSQGYLTATAARALIFIESDNPNIGLMCVMAVGMSDVSTCDITVKPGDRMTKGQELGMFHFGGSTYCMIFRPGVKVEFSCGVGDEKLINSAVARVSDRTSGY